MKKSEIKYQIYPSLLDKFQTYLDSQKELERNWNRYDETEDYKRTIEEIEEANKKSLIDSINRIPHISEAADKGTAFNEIIDCLIYGRDISTSEKIKLERFDKNSGIIFVSINGFNFAFDLEFMENSANYFKGAISNVYVNAILSTMYGDVKLYGYVDEIVKDTIYDVKTTSRYEFGKYENGWQRHVYPFCILEIGFMDEIKAFEYTCFKLTGGTKSNPVIRGEIYPEYYGYNHEESKEILINHCEKFISFIEDNRSIITDKKIFNEI